MGWKGWNEPVAKMVTLGKEPFICVKLRPFELVKTNGFSSLGKSNGEADPTVAKASNKAFRDNILRTGILRTQQIEIQRYNKP